jgi:hypothetical protein
MHILVTAAAGLELADASGRAPRKAHEKGNPHFY